MKVKINMKKYLFVLMLLPMLWVGCEENNYSPHLRELKSNLIGTWQWVETHIELPSPHDKKTPESEGYNKYYIFEENDTWRLMRDERLLSSGIFKIKKVTDCGEPFDGIYLYGSKVSDAIQPEMIELHKDNNDMILTIVSYPCIPGTSSSKWKKISSK